MKAGGRNEGRRGKAEDSYGGSILEPLSQNRYAYTGNKGFPGTKDQFEHNDGSTVEFLGWDIKENTVNLTNKYQILHMIEACMLLSREGTILS